MLPRQARKKNDKIYLVGRDERDNLKTGSSMRSSYTSNKSNVNCTYSVVGTVAVIIPERKKKYVWIRSRLDEGGGEEAQTTDYSAWTRRDNVMSSLRSTRALASEFKAKPGSTSRLSDGVGLECMWGYIFRPRYHTPHHHSRQTEQPYWSAFCQIIVKHGSRNFIVVYIIGCTSVPGIVLSALPDELEEVVDVHEDDGLKVFIFGIAEVVEEVKGSVTCVRQKGHPDPPKKYSQKSVDHCGGLAMDWP